MTSQEIVQSIQNWDNICQNSVELVRYFNQGNCYTYSFPAYADSSPFMHAYPGIYQNKLYFFMIPSNFDTQAYASTINQYTTACLIQTTLGDDRLTPTEAKARMKAWKDNYATWIPAQVSGSYGMFEAFAIKREDFEVQNVVISLGLRAQASASGGAMADLIVSNKVGFQINYDDFAQPVPPFSVAPTAQSEFYLLSANI